MSTSLLYRGFGVRGYRLLRTRYVGGKVKFTIDQDQRRWRCSACRSRDLKSKGRVTRRFRTVPIGRKPVEIVFAIPRVKCRRCGAIRQVRVNFADPRRSYTKSFERYALDLSRGMTIRDVADHLSVGWDAIEEHPAAVSQSSLRASRTARIVSHRH